VQYHQYKACVRDDLYRLNGDYSPRLLVRALILGGGFQFIFWFRTAAYAGSSKRLLRFTIYPVARVMMRRSGRRYGIDIPHGTQIGPGLYIGHAGGIVVNQQTVIGRNCNLSQGVTLGQSNRGRNKGCAEVGDNVYFGPGSKVVGSVTIGSDVAIGANCVVTRDVPNGSVVVGIPGKVISSAGATGYVTNRT
jgi:serine O-acetyltransferase